MKCYDRLSHLQACVCSFEHALHRGTKVPCNVHQTLSCMLDLDSLQGCQPSTFKGRLLTGLSCRA